MKTVSNKTFELEVSTVSLDLAKEYEKVANCDHNVIRIIDAAEDRLAQVAITNKKGKYFVSMENASKITMETVLTYRHMCVRNFAMGRLNGETKEGIEARTEIAEEEKCGNQKKGSFFSTIWNRLIHG